MSDLLLKQQREPLQASFSDASNPIGLDGIEFIEYTTNKPQALGQVLEMMGFKPVARHRSREVTLYRQGQMNIVVNANPADTRGESQPSISAIALRVRDARSAFAYAIERGAWAVPTSSEVMELNIPAIHGVGDSRIYFVDRYNEFSIYDVDFVPIPGVDAHPAATAGIHFFGTVQYIGSERNFDWIEFYEALLGFQLVPDEERFGIMPKGKLLNAPSIKAGQGFMWQLVEPDVMEIDSDEKLQRIGLGVPDVIVAVKALRALGVEFVESNEVHAEARGAITKTYLGSVMFELVQSTK
ncbi:MAG: 4-hydroxyphenylpyruvate dioxygenase [Pseudomonadota bacterium]|jgi:4-hydroxyphenylpyruvate dioxygenase